MRTEPALERPPARLSPLAGRSAPLVAPATLLAASAADPAPCPRAAVAPGSAGRATAGITAGRRRDAGGCVARGGGSGEPDAGATESPPAPTIATAVAATAGLRAGRVTPTMLRPAAKDRLRIS